MSDQDNNLNLVSARDQIDKGSLPNSIQAIANSIFRETLDDGVIVYTLATTSWLAINQWLDTVVTILDAWPAEEPCRLIYDFTRISLFSLRAGSTYATRDLSSIGITPEFNERIDKILKAKLNFRVRLAVVVNTTLSARVTRVVATNPIGYRLKYFATREKAIEWLHWKEMDSPIP